MGKTKIKTIDDAPQEEEAKKPAKKLGRQDELVERLKAELAGTEPEAKAEKPKKEAEKAEEKPVKEAETSGKKPAQTQKSKPRSKKYKEASTDLDKSKTYSLNEAIEQVKNNSYSKFMGTLEAHINTVQANMRGLVSLPFASGKKLRILAFGSKDTKLEDVILGDESTIEEINKGKVDFDLVVTTPEWMPKLAKVARILGPRGIMPNPKNGTITQDLKKSIESFQAGKTEYKTEPKAKVIHLGLGKLNQPTEELSANITTLIQTLGKTRVKKVTLSPTMGPSVKLDLSSL